LAKSHTQSFPVFQSGDFFISGTNTIMRYLLSTHEQTKNDILGANNDKSDALITMWTDFCSFNIWPLIPHVIGQIIGKTQKNKDVFNMAIEDLMIVLKKIDSHLSLRTFLVGNSFTYADLIVASSLNLFFTLILDENKRSQCPNVTRWFMFSSNVPQLSSVR